MKEAKTFSTADLDVIGLDRFREYLEKNGWIDFSPVPNVHSRISKPGTWIYRKHGFGLFLCDPSYGDYYIRFSQAVCDLAAAEERSIVRTYLALLTDQEKRNSIPAGQILEELMRSGVRSTTTGFILRELRRLGDMRRGEFDPTWLKQWNNLQHDDQQGIPGIYWQWSGDPNPLDF